MTQAFELFKTIKAVEPTEIFEEIFQTILQNDLFLEEAVSNSAYAYTHEILLLQEKLVEIQASKKHLENNIETPEPPIKQPENTLEDVQEKAEPNT